ncbi:MAG: YdcF family protein [Leptolyngbyaceae cyanobacterium]
MKGISQLLPDGNIKMATSVVVLGRGPDDRLERSLTASELFYKYRVNIFVSGMSDAPEILDHLAKMGVPEKHLTGERCSQTTWENALFSDSLMEKQVKKTVILITDEPHLLRAYLVFKGFGFDIIPYGVPREESDLLSLNQAVINLREYLALIAYVGKGKLWLKSEKQQRADKYQAKQKIIDWGCSLR